MLRLSRWLGGPWCLPSGLALFLGLRLALVLAVPVEQTSDFLWYLERAREIAFGAGYAIDGHLTAFWPPGWPGTLALLMRMFGPSPMVGAAANLACSALVFALLLRLSGDWFGDRRIGRLAVLLLAVYPNQIAYVPLLSTELFYQALLLSGLFLLSRGTLAMTLLGGVVFGLACLTKAQTIPLPALLLLVAWWSAGRRPPIARQLIVTYLAMAVVIAPWTTRNYAVFDSFIPASTNGGFTLLAGNNPAARGGYIDSGPLFDDLPRAAAREPEMDRMAKTRALDWILHHPAEVAVLLPRKLFRLWAWEGEAEWLYQAGYPGYSAHETLFRAVRIANQGYYCLLMVLAALSLWRLPGHSPWRLSGWVVAGYFSLVTLVFLGQSRFHAALMPLLLLYAAATILYQMKPELEDDDAPGRHHR